MRSTRVYTWITILAYIILPSKLLQAEAPSVCRIPLESGGSSGVSAGLGVPGTVFKVVDGDTLDLKVAGTIARVRLYGINAPEKGKPYSKVAGDRLKQLTLGKVVYLECRGEDKYGRVVGLLRLRDRTVINYDLVCSGHAWWFKRYAPADEHLSTCARNARSKKLGLFGDTAPTKTVQKPKRS